MACGGIDGRRAARLAGEQGTRYEGGGRKKMTLISINILTLAFPFPAAASCRRGHAYTITGTRMNLFTYRRAVPLVQRRQPKAWSQKTLSSLCVIHLIANEWKIQNATQSDEKRPVHGSASRRKLWANRCCAAICRAYKAHVSDKNCVQRQSNERGEKKPISYD